ncbi:MAG TPA: DNA alkylation repair protein [Gemmatimonadaceae bacterium]|nr:DNA alkylation repair protein [Gemmatimonadaceae bacterium]
MPSTSNSKTAARSRADEVVASLERLGNKRTHEEMATRYGIVTPRAFGVPMSGMQRVAKGLGKDHALAGALWDTGWYEARIVAALIDDPALVTAAQMDRWCRDFDNWAICDTLCFKLFDRTPHAWRKVEQWSARDGEFVKRAAFALLASLALHDNMAPDSRFTRYLPLIERAAGDERNFVKKGVSWALRAIGGRSLPLNEAAMATAERLAASPSAAARWVGKDALRAFTPALRKRLAARVRAAR